jgi:hypothetical protein
MAGETIRMGAVQAFQGKFAQVMAGKASGCINHGMCGTQSRKSDSGGQTKTDAKKHGTIVSHKKAPFYSWPLVTFPGTAPQSDQRLRHNHNRTCRVYNLN